MASILYGLVLAATLACSNGRDLYLPAGGGVGLAARLQTDATTSISDIDVEPLHPVARFLQEVIDNINVYVYVKEPIQLADDCVHAADVKLLPSDQIVSLHVARIGGLHLEASAPSAVVGNVLSVVAAPTVSAPAWARKWRESRTTRT